MGGISCISYSTDTWHLILQRSNQMSSIYYKGQRFGTTGKNILKVIYADQLYIYMSESITNIIWICIEHWLTEMDNSLRTTNSN